MKLVSLLLFGLSLLVPNLVFGEKVLLVVQSDLYPSISHILTNWKQHLEREGHSVETILGPKENRKQTNQVLDFARSQVWPWVNANPSNYLFFIGDLPMAYSGYSINPDGHDNTSGVYASTLFYGCPSTNWTDIKDNSGFNSLAKHVNLPGDGKFDNDIGPRWDNPASIGPLKAKIGWLNCAYNPLQYGVSNMTSKEYVINSYERYFGLNIKWRNNAYKDLKRVGIGVSSGNFPGSLNGISWANVVGTNNMVQFTRAQSLTLEDYMPFMFVNDFKGITESVTWWKLRPPGTLYSFLDLTWGSYQVDYRTLRTWHPMNCGALGLGNMGRNWNLVGWETKTLGQIWEQTVNGIYSSVHIILYGDPTLRFKNPKRLFSPSNLNAK